MKSRIMPLLTVLRLVGCPIFLSACMFSASADDARPRLEPLTHVEWKRSLECVAFSPDGRFLAAGGGSSASIGGKGEAKVWTVPDMAEVHHLRKMETTVESIHLLPGKTLACQTGSRLFLHNLAAPGKPRLIDWHRSLYYGLLAPGTEPVLLTGVVLRGDAEVLEAIGLRSGGKSPLPFGLLADDLVIFSLDGQEYLRMAAAEPATLTIHSAENGCQLHTLAARELASRHVKLARWSAFEFNNGVLALENREFEPRFLFHSTGDGFSVVPVSAVKSTSPSTWALSPDGRILLLPACSSQSDNAGQLEVMDVRLGKVVQTLPNESPVFGSGGFNGPGGYSSVAFSPDGKLAASVVPYYGKVRLYKVVAPASE